MVRQRTVAMVGSVNMDLMVRTSRVPARGENLLASGFRTGLGGKGSNPAVALARMGAEAHLVACVGRDRFGEEALGAMRRERVHVEGIRTVADHPTGIALIMVDDDGENTILVVPGANEALTPAAVEAGLAPLAGRLDALMVSFEIPEACVAAAVAAGRAGGVPVVVDAGPPRHYSPSSWADATVLSPNRLEAEALVGYPLADDQAATRAARTLRDLGPQGVVLKLGARGALLCSAECEEWVPAFQVAAVDTTGAGDAFTAALTLALAEGRALPDAVRFANAAGALTVTRLGTMSAMPTRAEIDAFLEARP